MLGVATRDFSLLYDLSEAARRRGVALDTFEPGDEPPTRVGVVITTPAESALVAAVTAMRGAPRTAVRRDAAPPITVVLATTADESLDRALAALTGADEFRALIVGVDPGERPGVAVIGDGRLLATAHAASPEAVQAEVARARVAWRADRFIVRVGRGAPTMRDRILRGLDTLAHDATMQPRLEVELVDEANSTPAAARSQAERDIAAAKSIALARGEPVAGAPLVRPSEGELRDLQRKSRIASQGRVTISRGLARAVAVGRISLDQAVARQLARSAR
ncbi:MAG: hypothetical protein ACYDCK_03915 [Thermoplasmatota archaeon]